MKHTLDEVVCEREGIYISVVNNHSEFAQADRTRTYILWLGKICR